MAERPADVIGMGSAMEEPISWKSAGGIGGVRLGSTRSQVHRELSERRPC